MLPPPPCRTPSSALNMVDSLDGAVLYPYIVVHKLAQLSTLYMDVNVADAWCSWVWGRCWAFLQYHCGTG